mgnify:CR=1 FL=1
MFIVQDYSLAILFCVVTMLCWGSWGNTQKLASKTWRYEFLLLGLRDWCLALFSDFRLYLG